MENKSDVTALKYKVLYIMNSLKRKSLSDACFAVFLKLNIYTPLFFFIEHYYRNRNKKEAYKFISNTSGIAGGSQFKAKSHEYSWHYHKYNGRCVITVDA